MPEIHGPRAAPRGVRSADRADHFEVDEQIPVGDFLEEIDFPGAVSRDLITKLTPLVEAAGAKGMARWQLAVRMAREAIADRRRLPTPEEVRARWQAGAPVPPDRRTLDFLVALGVENPTVDVLTRYRRLVAQIPPDDPDLWQTAVSMTANARGRRPPQFTDLVAEHARRREVAEQKAAERQARIGALALQVAESARAYVTQTRQETSKGPTWREVTRHLGIGAKDTEPLIEELHRIGAVVSTTEPHSLAAAEDWRPAG